MIKQISGFLLSTLLLLSTSTLSNSISGGQDGESPGPGNHVFTINVNGLERRYLLHVPPSYDGAQAAPLVFVFHGGGGAPQQIARRLGFNELSDKHGFLVVYPEGIDGHWNDGRGNPSWQHDDVGFIRTLIEHSQRTLNVDASRIYATGHSNGGIFTQRLGCELSDLLAAIAPSAGTVAELIAPPQGCAPSDKISVVEFHGTADRFVPYEGGVAGQGGRVLSVDATIAHWVKHNNLSISPRVTYEPDLDPTDGTRVRREAYTSLHRWNKAFDVVIYAIEGGGHSWPGVTESNPATGPVCLDINASVIVWDFFAQHPKRKKRNAVSS